MGKPTGFLEIERQVSTEVEPLKRIKGHGVTWYYVAYGLFHGLGLVINDAWLRKKKTINKELVEYKNVKSRYDEDQLKEMIQKHYQYTNSNVAKKILDDFGNEVAHFKKVVPHDYKRMMSLISSFEQQGLTNEQAKVEAFNAFKKGM